MLVNKITTLLADVTVFLNCFGTFFETVLTFSKLWVQMSQLFAGTSELYCMSAKCSYSPKNYIHASKPSYCVSNLAKATKI